MKKAFLLLLACLILGGCASTFGKKELGAKERSPERRQVGFQSMEDLAEGTTYDKKVLGLP